MSPATLRAIILFLYGTGLRVEEALALTDSNIHFHGGLIEIHPGSLYRHRTILMGADVQHLLRRYLRSAERASFGIGKALFLTTTGRPVPYSMLRETFRRLRTVARVFRPNSPLPPRLQDLRHTFAVHSISRWADEGWSYEKMLPMLASYMGNVCEKGFLRYFELTPSCFRPQLACLDVPSSIPNLARRLESGNEGHIRQSKV
jgi:integrase/recombinase XerD